MKLQVGSLGNNTVNTRIKERLKDFWVVALMSQMYKNSSRSTPITSIMEHKNGKELTYV